MLLLKRIFMVTGCLVLVLGFQNCSDFALKDELKLEAAILESVNQIDADAFPRLLETNTLTRWYKSSQPNFKSETMIGDQFSIVMAINRSTTGEVFRLHTDGQATTTQASVISISGGKIRATRSDSGASYEQYLEGDLPSGGDEMVIAASFGKKAGDINLLINGIWVQSKVVTASGTPGDFSYLTKAFDATSLTANSVEFMIYTGDSDDKTGFLSPQELNALSRYIANNHLIAEVKFDPSLIGGQTPPASGGGDSPEFLAVKSYITNRCLSCHSGTYQPNLSGFTQKKALDSGLVIAGNAASSPLYQSLQGSGGPYPGVGGMPMGGSNSGAELQAVRDWINGL